MYGIVLLRFARASTVTVVRVVTRIQGTSVCEGGIIGTGGAVQSGLVIRPGGPHTSYARLRGFEAVGCPVGR